ncbi:MAG TPA: DUF2884 family protein [Gammaproteobacteria bacterium]
MQKFLRIFLFGALCVSPPLHADNTPVCDALDARGHDSTVDFSENFTFDDGDLILKRDGQTLLVITEDRDLYYAGRKLELTPRGRALANEYYVSMEAAVDEFLNLAGDAAGLGISAAVRAIAQVVTGGLDEDEFEREVEAEAREIEAQADLACSHLLEIERIEAEMVEEIPGFRPVMFGDETHSI